MVQNSKLKGNLPMENSSQPEIIIHPIQKEVRKAESLSIDYHLYRVTTCRTSYYALEILLHDEQCMQVLGSDEKIALRLFEIMVNERVTPCTLTEILHDIKCEEEERLHLQNLCKM